MNPNPSTLDLSRRWFHFTRLLRSRVWTALTFFTVTLLVVVVGTSLQTPVYRTAATVLIDMETPNVLTVSTSRDDTTFGQANYLTYADYYRTQVEIIKSRAIASRVFNNLELGEKAFYKQAKDPISRLLKQISVEPIKQTRLARVYAEDRNPRQAARIANEFALVFVEQNLVRAARAEAMTLMKNEYLKLQSKEAELSKRYKDKFPAVSRVRQQMNQLSQAIEEETKQQMTQERLEAEEGPMASEQSRKALLKRYEESTAVAGLRPNNIRLQDFAETPTRPAKPNAMLNFILGCVLGLLGGLGAAVVEELLDSSLKVPEDLEGDPHLPLLGHIPQFDGAGSEAKIPLPQRYQHVQLGSHSAAAEAYRALRTNLIYAAPPSKSQAVIVTSPGSGEGKSTTLTNLGISLAHMGLKVLLVDADLRKPRLHEAFKLAQKPGLSEYLIGQASFEKVVQPTSISGLWMVTSGACPPNPAELLGLNQMQEFLTQAGVKFDRILIDTPPVIAVTDATVLAAMTGTVLVVARSGKTHRQALYRTTSIIQDVRAKILGIVLNDVLTSHVPAYYGYSSHYSESEGGKNGQHAVSTLDRLTSLIKRFKDNHLSSFRRGGNVAESGQPKG